MDDRAARRASPSLSPPPPPPRRLGRYELIALLAKGGMGEVHLAKVRGVGGFERLVVVKCALPAMAERTQQLLLAEARLAATLQHANIVQVHDVDTDGDTVFLAMEYLHGQDVRAVLARSWGQRRPLGLDGALAIALATCAGLHYAHDKHDSDGQPLEIVHRDVSPSNVFATYDGAVKLIDFGIAKATTLPSETQLGTIKGKPGYMSPEQCRCEPLDRRSDVFCIGILLYELTLGRRPFHAANEYLLTKQILDDDPPRPSAVEPTYAPELEAIVMRALAKPRADRYPSAGAVQDALAAFVGRHRLDVSQFALGRAMASLFEAELAAWHAAQRAGQSLVEHVVNRTTTTAAIVVDPPSAAGELHEPGGSLDATIAVSPRADAARPSHRRRALAIAAAAGAVAIAGAIAIVATVAAPPASPPPASPPLASPPPASPPASPPLESPPLASPPPASPVQLPAAGAPTPPSRSTTAPVAPRPQRPAKRPPRTGPKPAVEPAKVRGPDELIE